MVRALLPRSWPWSTDFRASSRSSSLHRSGHPSTQFSARDDTPRPTTSTLVTRRVSISWSSARLPVQPISHNSNQQKNVKNIYIRKPSVVILPHSRRTKLCIHQNENDECKRRNNFGAKVVRVMFFHVSIFWGLSLWLFGFCQCFFVNRRFCAGGLCCKVTCPLCDDSRCQRPRPPGLIAMQGENPRKPPENATIVSNESLLSSFCLTSTLALGFVTDNARGECTTFVRQLRNHANVCTDIVLLNEIIFPRKKMSSWMSTKFF